MTNLDSETQEILDITSILLSKGPMFSGNDVDEAMQLAEEWYGCGFEDWQVELWCEAGCWEADTAFVLSGMDFDPKVNKLAYCSGCERDDMSAMYAVCNNDISLKHVQII